jgi:hypothetical protein
MNIRKKAQRMPNGPEHDLQTQLRPLSDDLLAIMELMTTDKAHKAATDLKEKEKEAHKSRGESFKKISEDAGKILRSMDKGVKLIQAGRGVEGSAEILSAASSTVNCVATLAKLGGFFPPPAGEVAAGIGGLLSLVSVIMELQASKEESNDDKIVKKIEKVVGELFSQEQWSNAKAQLDQFDRELSGLRARVPVDFHTMNWLQVEAASKVIEGGGGSLALNTTKYWLTLSKNQELPLWNDIFGIWLLAAKKTSNCIGIRRFC